MRRLLLAAALIACSSAPQPKPEEAAPAPGSAANPPAAQVAGSGQNAPPAAGQPAAPVAPAAATSAAAPARAEPPAIDEAAMDKSADPCTDFYQYACGGWLKATPIPEDRGSWGRGFSEIAARNEVILRDLLEKDAKGEKNEANPFSQKTGDFYATCMDEEKAETASLSALQAELKKIDGVKDPKALAAEVASLHQHGARPFFGFSSQQDAKDATLVIGAADQGGMGMPDRDYYLKDDARMKGLRELYESHIAKMLELTGARDSAKQAKSVMALETELAKAAMDKVSRRDPNKVYHRLERKGLTAAAPKFLWDVYFTSMGQPELQAVNVVAPDFFKGLNAVLAKTKPADLQTYLRWHAVRAAAPALGKAFVEEQFRYGKALSGAKAILPRWKRCVALTDRALGEALGRSFVVTTIGEEGKAQAREIVQGIESAFEKNLETLEWMDAKTREASNGKLKKVANMIGYPDTWRDYSSVAIGRESLLANIYAAAAFESKRDLAKIGKPVDKKEFGMSPPTVNAYYEPALNEMVFPAGIMQTPFFKTGAAVSTNYGGLGMVMGHELTHGFDDEGRQFDGDGNLHEWWSPEVNKAFNERAECVAKQYDGYVAVEDAHLNGHLTLGENIADIGGLKMALRALHQKTGKSDNGQDRNFFIAFAQTWCTSYRPEQARLQAQTNPHSTAQWRVNGPTQDNPDFAQVFQCKPGSPMAPVNRCTVW